MGAMHKMLFFFFILLLSFQSQQKLASDPSIGHLSQISAPFSSSVGQNKIPDDAYLEKRDLGSTQSLLHKFNPSERSILDYVSQTQFDLPDQMNHGSNLHSDNFKSSIDLEQKDHDIKRGRHQPSFQGEFEQSGKGITRLLQTETDFINVLEENLKISNIWENNMEEEISFGESENGEGEGGENESESESGEGGPGSGETGEGETNEDTEGSWLEGEVCFEGQSSDEEIIIIEGQESGGESEGFRLLASNIDININVDINIEIEKVEEQEQKNEEVEAFTFSITSIDPGGNNCHSERICRYVNIPRLGKRCICRQQVICLY